MPQNRLFQRDSLLLPALCLTATCAVGCSDDPAPTTPADAAADVAADVSVNDVQTVDAPVADAPRTDAASDAASTDVLATDATSTDAGAGTIRVRVAHLSPNAPAVDFCLRAASATAFSGRPTLAGLSIAAGLRYTQVTQYLEVPAGQYVARIVAPGAANCDTALGGLADVTLPALPAGTVATVAATGLLGATGSEPAFALTPFVDDATAPPMGQAKIRFVHTAPGVPSVDVGALAGDTFTGIFNNVAYGTALMANRGYINTPPLSGATLAARPAGMAIPTRAGYPLVLDGVSVPAAANITVFAIGRLGNDQTPLSALVCNDGAAPAMGLSSCAVLPPRIGVRVAHLSPNAPAVDFCVKAMGAADSTYAGPVLESLGIAPGAAFPAVTGYIPLAPGAYTVRLVAADATNCATSLAGLPSYDLPNLPAGARATVGAVGRVGDTGATAFRLTPFVDGNTQPLPNRVHLRFLHTAPGVPAVDVGVLAGTTFTPVFSNTAFPNVAATMGAEMGTGYLPIDPIMGATLAVRATGSTDNALTLTNVSLAGSLYGTAVSVFAIGELPGAMGQGAGNRRLSAFVCQDRVAATGSIAPCARLPAM